MKFFARRLPQPMRKWVLENEQGHMMPSVGYQSTYGDLLAAAIASGFSHMNENYLLKEEDREIVGRAVRLLHTQVWELRRAHEAHGVAASRALEELELRLNILANDINPIVACNTYRYPRDRT